MFWDIVIVGGIAFTQLVITIYAVVVSVADKKMRSAFIIGLVGAVGIALTVYGAIRSGHTQEALQAQIDKIEKHTEQPPPIPQVTVNVPPSVQTPPQLLSYPRMEGNSESVNGQRVQPNTLQFADFTNAAGRHEVAIYFVNPGPGPAKDVLYGAVPLLVSGNNTRATEEFGFLKFKEWWLAHQKEKHPEFWSPGERSASDGMLVLSDSDITAIRNDTSQLYAFAAIQWSDDAGRHQYEFCANFRPNYLGIRECDTHSFVEKGVLKLASDKRLY